MKLFVFPGPRAGAPADDAGEFRAAFVGSDHQGRLLQSGEASLSSIAAMRAPGGRLILVLPACDVTLFRLQVPPLSPARLQAALPAIVEENILSSAEDCVIVVGPAQDGMRRVAVAERAWLSALLEPFVAQGWQDITALPAHDALAPDNAAGTEGAVAMLRLHACGVELCLRLAAAEPIGLLLPAVLAQQPDAILDTIAALAPGRSLSLLLPTGLPDGFRSAIDAHASRVPLSVTEYGWPLWQDAMQRCDLDLAEPLIGASPASAVPGRWRRTLQMAAALLLLHLTSLTFSSHGLQREADGLKRQMLASFRQALPDETTIVDPLLQMRRRHASLQGIGSWAGMLAGVDGALREIAEGAAVAPIKSARYDDAMLTLRWQSAAERPSREALAAALGRRGLTIVETVDDDGIRIRSGS